MASQPAVLQSCFELAAKVARPALEHCVDVAVASLQAAELQSMKVAERDELAMAWRQLLDNKPAWGTRYPSMLRDTFVLPPVVNDSRPAPQSDYGGLTGSRRVGGLSLVDDAHVTQAIESSRLLQHILPKLEQVLAELDSLVSSAQGLNNVQPELNPFRPQVFTQSLQDIMAATAHDPALVATWIRHLADPLGREIKLIYEQLVQLLQQAHIPAAHYRVLQTPASAMPRARQADAGGFAGPDGSGSGNGGGHGAGNDRERNGGSNPPSQYADLSNYEIRDELFQDFLFHGGSNARHGLTPSYYETVEEELAALQDAPDSSPQPLSESSQLELQASERAVPAVDRPRRSVDVSSPLNSQLWGTYARSRERAIVRTQLKKEATQVGQVLGLEVVRKLVNQVAQDPRLLLPVREAIVALEPSLLRLAMVDPRFFSAESHPGRRLMERVAQRSFKYNDEYSTEFASFFEGVTNAFNALNASAIENSRLFGQALATLEHAWDAYDQIEFSARHKVLTALHFAEERQEVADQIAFDLSSRSDLDNVPGVVLDFLFGPWSLAMAHAKLADQRNQVDPEGFRSVVPDLLWSVKRDVTLKRPVKLIAMIPGLLEKLHSGLDLLGQAPHENAAFFESLMKLHQPVLKLRRLKSRRDAEESHPMPLEEEIHERPATPEQRQARVAEQPWLGRDDLDAAGFQDTLPTEPADLMPMADASLSSVTAPRAGDMPMDATPLAPSKPVPPTSAEAENILLGLRTGSWVDLYSKHQWLRAQLIWASTKATLFMFLSHGGQPHSMTKRSCEKLIMQRWLRAVDTHAVVAQALDALASEASAKPRAPACAGVSRSAPVSQDEAETV